jgi:hypothetical protein
MTTYVHPKLRQAIEEVAKNKTLAACCLVFVSQLYIKAAEKDGTSRFMPLSSKISRRIYTTRQYGRMLATLRRVSAIQVFRGGSYEPRKVSKRYRLNPAFCVGVQECSVTCPRLEARLEAAMNAASCAAMAGPARRWILKTYKSLSFSAAIPDLLRHHSFKTEESRTCTRHHLENIAHGRLRFWVCPISGRVYYPMANLPKVFRAEALIDGESVKEIDISACQPTLLATLYPADCPEKARYLALTQSGRFYETIAGWINRSWPRDEAKTQFFNQIAYGSYYCSDDYELLVPFTARFPVLANEISEIKRRGNAILPLRMQKLEATIVIDGACGECAKRKIRVLPVHDSLICRAEDVIVVKEIFARHWEGKTGIPAKLKVA